MKRLKNNLPILFQNLKEDDSLFRTRKFQVEVLHIKKKLIAQCKNVKIMRSFYQ